MNRSETIFLRKQETDKKQYLGLLLLGDEQESMIDRYLERGEMFVMFAADTSNPIGVAVITDEGNGVCELKNIAIAPMYQRKGYGKKILKFLYNNYKGLHQTMMVGTGNSEQTTLFYRSCGFKYSHTIRDFFIVNYDHPIIEEGKQLRDMIYFSRELR